MADAVDKKEVQKIDEETALLEVTKFLDFKKVSERKRNDTFEQQVKDLVGLMLDGRLTFDFEKKRAKFSLLAPLKQREGGEIKELVLRFFIGIQESNMALKNVDATDGSAKSVALAAALSGLNPSALINAENAFGEKGLDMSDHNAMFAYTLFFLI